MIKCAVWVLVVVIFLGCSPKIPMYSNNIINIPQTEDGTIYLQCSGVGSSKKAAFENAIYNAFSAIIFQGVPASVQQRPMVNPANAANVSAKVDACLKDNNCYRKFITQISGPDENIAEVNKGFSANPKIKINLRVLRGYLEQNGIIPKAFTY